MRNFSQGTKLFNIMQSNVMLLHFVFKTVPNYFTSSKYFPLKSQMPPLEAFITEDN
jgi:hypothetical protein